MNADPTVLAFIGLAEIVLVVLALVVMGVLVAGIVVFVVMRGSRGSAPAAATSPGVRPDSGTQPLAAASPAPQVASRCPRCGGTRVPGAVAGLCPKCLLEVGMGTQSGDVSENRPRAVPDAETLAREFPALEVGDLLGQGGMGLVFRARQKALDRWVALKLLPRAETSDPAFAERFHREARALARLSHPSIVAVYEFGETPGFFFLILEYVDGTDLRQALREKRLGPADVLRIVPAICEALQFAHANGVVHRDIKPANILLDREGRVKITDFGIAKLIGTEGTDVTLTQTRQSVGTPHYMAPEQVETPQTVDHRADIYSLGVVFYEMLTGELPLGHFPPPSHKVQVDVRFDEVVLRALEKEPARRYQAASQVKSEVERITAESRGTAFPGGSPGAPAPAARSPEVGGQPTRPYRALVLPLIWILVHCLTWFVAIALSRAGSAARLGVLGLLFVLLGIVGALAPLGVTFLTGLTLKRSLASGNEADVKRRRWAFALGALFPVLSLMGLGFVVWMILLRAVGGSGIDAEVTAAGLSVVLGGVGAVFGLRKVWRWVRAPEGNSVPLAVSWVLALLLGGAGSLASVFAVVVNASRRPAAPAVAYGPGTGIPLGQYTAVQTPHEAGRGWQLGAGGIELSPAASRAFTDSSDANAWANANDELKRSFDRYETAVMQAMTVTTNELGRAVYHVPAMPATLAALENEFWAKVDPLLTENGQRILRFELKLRGATQTARDGLGQAIGVEHTVADAVFAIGDSDFTVEVWKVGSWSHYHAKWASGTEMTGNGPALPDWLRRLKLEDAKAGGPSNL